MYPIDILQHPQSSKRLEYLLTNGNGSYSNLSISGSLNRRQHGLLVVACQPPMGRQLLWHNVIEHVNDKRLSPYQEIVDQENTATNLQLESFKQKRLPTWVFCVDGVWIEKQIAMAEGKDAVSIRYRLLTPVQKPIHLQVDCLIHQRPINETLAILTDATTSDWQVNEDRNNISFPDNELNFSCSGDIKWHESPKVTNRILYDIETHDQGYLIEDSTLCMLTASFTLRDKKPVFLTASAENVAIDGKQLFIAATRQANKLIEPVSSKSDFQKDLTKSASKFIAIRHSVNSKTLLAGFPWFGDWGRDSMISIPGVCLATGQFETAKSILSTFAHYIDKGMLPNKFPDFVGDELSYNTIDATLWFFYAVQKYVQYTGDWQWVREKIYAVFTDIIHQHETGTRFGIKMSDDGLLEGGDPSTQLTWMDVKYGNVAVTPRWGKAVEINALWYNALCFYRDCQTAFKIDNAPVDQLVSRIKSSFTTCFWLPESGFLADYVNNNEVNSDLRPNQIIAVSLPYSPLTKEQQSAVLKSVQQKLYTPMGLRTLSPDHPNYKPRYYGSLQSRDQAYHQGTVWPWLIGPFIDAFMKVHQDQKSAAKLLKHLKNHFYYEAGVHGISEVADGDSPHIARGCFNQAWSVAELLRVIHEYQLDV